jgi:hypothetical protein
MSENNDKAQASADDVIVSWRDRIAKRSGSAISPQTGINGIPPVKIDVRQSGGRPPPPERLSAEEAALWEQIVASRHPGWFSGGEAILETYFLTVLQVRQIEAALRRTKVGTDGRYQKLARLHRQSVAQSSLLAVRLRLTPGARIAWTQPASGDVPLP